MLLENIGKLKPRYYGPYKITEVINEVAVRLALPPRARLHDVFHVNLLKKFRGDPPTAPPPLPTLHHGAVTPEPERVIKFRWLVVWSKCWSSGRERRLPRQHGKTGTRSSPSTPDYSSAT